jgi:hypothetical protein
MIFVFITDAKLKPRDLGSIKNTEGVPADILDSYTGDYVMNDITLSIKRNGDHLYLFQKGNKGLQIFFTSNTDFSYLNYLQKGVSLKTK